MPGRKLLVFGSLAGVAYGVLETAGFMVGNSANPNPMEVLPSGDTAARIASTPMPPGVWLGFGLEVFSTLFLVAFAVAGYAAARAADERGLLATAALSTAIVTVALTFVSFGAAFAINATAGHGLESQGLIVLSGLQTGVYILSWPVSGAFIACLSIAGLRARSIAPWVAWFGMVVGAAQILSTLSPLDGPGQLVQLVPLVWIPVAGIAFASRRSAKAAVPAGVVARA